jgi:hypothetical protein
MADLKVYLKERPTVREIDSIMSKVEDYSEGKFFVIERMMKEKRIFPSQLDQPLPYMMPEKVHTVCYIVCIPLNMRLVRLSQVASQAQSGLINGGEREKKDVA